MKNTYDKAEFFTVKEVKEILGIGLRQCYVLFDSSVFPSMRLNSKHVVSRRKFKEWLQKNAGRQVIF